MLFLTASEGSHHSGDNEGKRRILRSLMNIRMPRRMPGRVLAVQDEYLKSRAEEKGIVHLADIPGAWLFAVFPQAYFISRMTVRLRLPFGLLRSGFLPIRE